MNRRSFLKTSGLALAGTQVLPLQTQATALPCAILIGGIVTASGLWIGWELAGCAKRWLNPPPPPPPVTNSVPPYYTPNPGVPPKKGKSPTMAASQPAGVLDIGDAADVFYIGESGLMDPNSVNPLVPGSGNPLTLFARTCFQVTDSLNNPNWIDVPFFYWGNTTFGVFQFGNRQFGQQVEQVTQEYYETPNIALPDLTGWPQAFWRAKQLT